MARSPRRLVPDYGRRFVDLTVTDGASSDGYPVTATIERVDPGYEGRTETIRARYVVGCDGARSSVRRSLGVALRGDAASKIWGVADLLAVTDFSRYPPQGRPAISPRSGLQRQRHERRAPAR